ncbi:DUF4012 domain-containing protein [candidate division WWE3 bacterium]|nr:DUF4012 domain-containing protein [candidate division WWE3 bacterium]
MSKNSVIKKSPLAPTVLVANGISFLGLNLCSALLDKGARVVVIDQVDEEVRSRAKKLLAHPNFALFNADPEQGVPDKIQSVDYIFSLTYPDDYTLKNRNLVSEAFATKSLLDLAVKSKARFALVEPLFYKKVSSKEGSRGKRSSSFSQAETFSSRHPELDSGSTAQDNDQAGYTYRKNSSFLRSLIWDYIENRKLNGRIIRLPVIYGPGMPLESSIGLTRFLSALLQGKNFKIFGDGVAKGHYLYIDEAVEGIIKPLFYKRTSGRIFKVLGSDSHADLELAFILKGLASGEVNLEYGEGGYAEFVFDTFLGEAVPRWEQEVSLKEGLQQTLEGFGYAVNEHAFKPTKVLENKLREREEVEAINSLLGLKRDQEEEIASGEVAYPDGLGVSLPSLPRLRLPKIKLPKLSLPKLEFPFFKGRILKGRSARVKKTSAVKSKKTSSRTSTREPSPKATGFKNAGFNTAPSKIGTGFKGTWVGYLITFLIFIFLFTLGAPLGLTAYSLKKAATSLEEVSLTMAQLQTNTSKESAGDAFANLHKAKNSFKRLSWVFTITGQKDTYKSLDNLLDSVTYFTGALYRSSKALDPFSSTWDVLNPNSPEVFATEDFEASRQELSYARNTLDQALASFKTVQRENLPKFVQPKYDEYATVLTKADSFLRDALLLTRALPDVVGVDSEKEYLLLLQNSNELRPTGGFIGSYATLSLKEGKIRELTLDDIYNPDGQIDSREIVSEIPTPLAEFLDEEYLHIRNANWDPDFPTSVDRIEDLFFKLENRTFDGVIALDLNFIQSLLDVTGPVFLAAYNEEINSENLYERTQYYSEFDYQEGISDKRGFLTVLGSKLLEQVFALPSEELPEFTSQVYQALEERHLLVSLDNPTMSNFLAERKWDGAMVTPEKDYLMVVNANLGGTKANYFVENSYDYSVTSDTRDGLLRAQLDLSYKHNGLDNAWPGGPYTDYARVYVPRGAKLTGATQSFDNAVPENVFEEVTAYAEGDYTVFAFDFVLEPQQEARFELNYDLPEALSFSKESKEYALYWQKQPGTSEDVFRFDFKGPFGTEIVSYSPAGVVKEKNIAAYEGLLQSDQSVDLVLK